MANLTFKRDPYLLGFAAIVVLVVGGLVFKGAVSWKEAAAFLTGALALPGLFGAKPSNDDDDDNTPTLRPPPPPPAAGAVAAILLFGFFVGGCTTSRAQARGTVLATAEAVKVGDHLCAAVALEKTDIELSRTCEGAYKDARSAVIVAAETIDAWDAGKKRDVACAVKSANEALSTSINALRRRGISLPKVIDDAQTLASALGGCS